MEIPNILENKSRTLNILLDPIADLDELDKLNEEELSRFRASVDIRRYLALREIEYTYLDYAYNASKYDYMLKPLMIKAWKQICANSDIGLHLDHISSGLAENDSGPLIINFRELSKATGKKIIEKKRKEGTHSPAGTYRGNTIELNLGERVIWSILLYGIGNESIPTLSTTAHELNHENTSSLMSERAGWSTFKRIFKTKQEFITRTTDLEIDLSKLPVGQFAEELFADIASFEIGASLFSRHYTTNRLIDSPSYKYVQPLYKRSENIERMKRIEDKAVQLSDLGLDSALTAIGFRAVLFTEFEEAKISHPKLKFNEFVTLQRLEDILDSFIANQHNKHALTSLDLETSVERFAKKTTLRNTILTTSVKNTFVEQTLADKTEDVFQTYSDDVNDLDGVRLSINGYSMPIDNDNYVEVMITKKAYQKVDEVEIRMYKRTVDGSFDSKLADFNDVDKAVQVKITGLKMLQGTTYRFIKPEVES